MSWGQSSNGKAGNQIVKIPIADPMKIFAAKHIGAKTCEMLEPITVGSTEGEPGITTIIKAQDRSIEFAAISCEAEGDSGTIARGNAGSSC